MKKVAQVYERGMVTDTQGSASAEGFSRRVAMRASTAPLVTFALGCVGVAAFVFIVRRRRIDKQRDLAASDTRAERRPSTPRKTLAEVSHNFFEKADATALIFTDAKIDDAMFLWTFFLLNLWRPHEHTVGITVVVIGIRDRASGVALVRHLFACAEKYAASVSISPLARVTIRVLASRNRAQRAPRHEIDTYRPYATGDPRAADEALAYHQDAPMQSADFVAVVAQFFMFEVGPSLDALERLTPRRGGVLAFQAGFNTATPDAAAERAIWAALTARVGEAGGSIVCISNGYSFAGTKSSRTMQLSHPFLRLLRAQDGPLWDHLLDAGVKESFRFALDQMSKFLAGDFGDCGGKLEVFRAEVGCDASTPQEAVSATLAERFLAFRERAAPGERNPVVHMCEQIHAAVAEACGARRADYLARSVVALTHFGSSIEITDCQHFACLLQNEEGVLWPCGPPVGNAVDFNSGQTGVLWAAKDVSGPRSFEWMSKIADVRTARACVTGPHKTQS